MNNCEGKIKWAYTYNSITSFLMNFYYVFKVKVQFWMMYGNNVDILRGKRTICTVALN